MKKLIFLLILLFEIICFNNVFALTSNKGKIYEIYYQESNVNVFASDETYHSMDYNGIMIKSTAEDYIFYCVGPETYLPNYSESTTNTHYVYSSKDTIINNTRLIEETYKKISLLAYYGYGYKDQKIDHTSKKWYGITQVMIWRVLRPDINYVFKESRYGKTNSNLYLKEVNELQALIDNHDKIPSFANNSYNITKGYTLTLEDTNNVLNNYEIANNSLANFKIQDNKLTIYTLEENGNTIVNLNKKQIVNNEFRFYKSKGNNQDLIIRGDVSFTPSTLDITVAGGTLEVYKVNEEGIYTEELEGTLFGIYDTDDNLILEFDISSEMEHFYLPFGTYYLKETKAISSYNIDNTIYSFTFDSENDYYKVTIPNSKIKGELVLEKKKGGGLEDYVLESNAKFSITNLKSLENYEITTDDKGQAKIVLPYGNYEVKQISGDLNYSFIKPFTIFIEEEKVYKYELVNIKKSDLKIIKKDYSSNEVISNTTFQIYKKDNTLIYTGITNEKGLLIVNNLDIGDYYIKEIKASKYYKLDLKTYEFSVIEYGKVIEIEIFNEKNKGALEFLKIDSNTLLPLENAKIRVYYTKTNELIYEGYTSSSGTIILDNIEAGTYYLYEVLPPYGYLLNKENLYFEINDDKEIIKLTMTNDKIVMPNTKVTLSYNVLLILFLIFMFVKGKDEEF